MEGELESIASNEALVKLMERTGYPMVQENGQRKFGPPPNWEGPAPEKGCEIFVGKIPRNCFEDELVPVFGKIGFLYEFRLMMDFSGTNRGYAFAMYTTVSDAKDAIRQLNNYEIRKGKHLGVVKSVDNCRLFVGNIPKTKTTEEVTDEMTKVTEGVSHVILYTTPRDKTKNRGFAFVEYVSHRAAAMARRKLIPGRIHLWGQQVMVDWAEPEPEVDDDIMCKVTVLYVRNLTESTTEDDIRDFFMQLSIEGVEKVKKLRDFAFVHFETREDAEYAIEKMQGAVLDNCEIEVTWAKPPEKVPSRHFRVRQLNMLDGAGSGGSPFHNGQHHLVRFVAEPLATQGVNDYEFNRNRGRTAIGLRNSRGILNGIGYGRGPAQFRFFGFPPPMHGMQFVPTATNPLALHHHHRTNNYPTQVLYELCQKWNLGEPIYNLHSPQSTANGSCTDVHLYFYKVTIPAFGPVHTPTKLSPTSDEAKQYAALCALQLLEQTLGAYGNNSGGSPEKSIDDGYNNQSSSSSPNGSCFSSPPRNTCQSTSSIVSFSSTPDRNPKRSAAMQSMSGGNCFSPPMAASSSANLLINRYAYVNRRPMFSSNSAASSLSSDFEQLQPATIPGMQPNLYLMSSYYPPATPTEGGAPPPPQV